MKAGTEGITLRHCHALAEFDDCVRLQRLVWGWGDVDVVPLPLFVVAAETGGQVLGAFDGERMVGFTMALAGYRQGRVFLHSHMTAVLPALQNRGIGRRLKLFQRDDALGRGIELVEWTFDPLELRNAYFNLVRLGAIARRYIPNCYGVTTSPLHGRLPTDRLVAEWWLRAPRVAAALGRTGTPACPPAARPEGAASPATVRIRVPWEIAELKQAQPDVAARIQAEVREQFLKWSREGYAATGFEIGEREEVYVLERWERAPEAAPARDS